MKGEIMSDDFNVWLNDYEKKNGKLNPKYIGQHVFDAWEASRKNSLTSSLSKLMPTLKERQTWFNNYYRKLTADDKMLLTDFYMFLLNGFGERE